MTRLRIGSALILGLLILLTGCAKAGPTPGGTTPSANVSIVLDRVGGDKAVRDHAVLNPDGSWTATDTSGKTKTGQLTAEQTAAVYKIATSAAFTTEAAKPTWEPKCVDAPTNTLTVGDKRVTFVDCLNDSTPASAASVLKVFQEKILT